MPKNCMDVPGFNNEAHNESLQETARMIPGNSLVLEVGTGWGMSTWSLLDSLPDGCELHVLDSFTNPDKRKEFHAKGVLEKHSHNPCVVEAINVFLKKGQLAAWNHSIDQHPRRSMVKDVHVMTSEAFRRTDKRKWAMVYLDGNHSYENVKSELLHWKDVPFLCGDDYHPAHQGVTRAVDEMLARDPKRIFWNDSRPKSGFWRAIKQ